MPKLVLACILLLAPHYALCDDDEYRIGFSAKRFVEEKDGEHGSYAKIYLTGIVDGLKAAAISSNGANGICLQKNKSTEGFVSAQKVADEISKVITAVNKNKNSLTEMQIKSIEIIPLWYAAEEAMTRMFPCPGK